MSAFKISLHLSLIISAWQKLLSHMSCLCSIDVVMDPQGYTYRNCFCFCIRSKLLQLVWTDAACIQLAHADMQQRLISILQADKSYKHIVCKLACTCIRCNCWVVASWLCIRPIDLWARWQHWLTWTDILKASTHHHQLMRDADGDATTHQLSRYAYLKAAKA